MEISSKFYLDIYDCAQHCMPSDFNEYALGKFKKIVHFDSAVIADLALARGRELVASAIHLHAVPVEWFHDRRKVLGAETLNRNGAALGGRSYALKMALAQRGKSVIVDVEKTYADREILNYLRKYETAHSLTFVSDQNAGGVVGVGSFWRARRKNAYSDNQGQVAALMLPHLLQAREINKRLVAGAATEPHGSATMWADFDGCLYVVDKEAIRLLQLEWKQWTPPILPHALIKSLKQDKAKVFVGDSICVKAAVHESMLCLTIVAKSKQAGTLTSAEYRVAQLASEGLQYKEIARRLDVSPATVRNQLHSIYSKLGISNKTALTAVLSS